MAPVEKILHYSSRFISKRKLDDLGTPHLPPLQRLPSKATGFTAPIIYLASDALAQKSCGNVPSPPDGIQLAKRWAQEIAARLFRDAEAKRPRVENEDGADDSNSQQLHLGTL